MLTKILQQVDDHRQMIAYLRQNSKPWPEIFSVTKSLDMEERRAGVGRAPDTVWLSTLVRIQRDGKWYLVHHVQSLTGNVNVEWLYSKLVHEVHLTQTFYRVTGNPELETLDPNQQSEEERLRDVYPHLKELLR